MCPTVKVERPVWWLELSPPTNMCPTVKVERPVWWLELSPPTNWPSGILPAEHNVGLMILISQQLEEKIYVYIIKEFIWKHFVHDLNENWKHVQ